MKDNKKETKVKFKFNVKETVEKFKTDYTKVKEKISTNIKSGELKKINKQNVKYYSMLALMLCVAIASTLANIRSYKLANKEEYKTYVNASSVSEQEEKKSENEKQDNADMKDEKNEEEVIPVVSNTYETAQSSISYVNNTNSGGLPVEGNIKREYSMDKVVYYESLEVWKTHSGVDIACDENAPVKAIIAGKVVGIYNDGMYGYSVVIEGEECTTVYSSLSEDVLVSIGKEVKAGDLVGYVSVSPAEQEMGYHLHFEVMKDGEYVNPEVLGVK